MYKIIGSDGNEYGPVSAKELREWLNEKRVNPQTQVRPEGAANWQSLESLPEFASLIGTPPSFTPPVFTPSASMPIPQKTSKLAIASLVLGILGFCSAGITSLIGLILGFVGLSKINKSNGSLGGKGLAIAGISVSGATLLLVIIMFPLMAALAIPGFVKARKQSQGRRVINDARQMDASIDQWALEKGKKDGDAINTSEAAIYLKGAWMDKDLLGNPYGVSVVGLNQIQISPSTKQALDGVGIDWGMF
jgi:hypothetical protein